MDTYDQDGYKSWLLLLAVVIGLIIIYVVSSTSIFSNMGQAFGTVGGEQIYNLEHRIDSVGNEMVNEYLYAQQPIKAICSGKVERGYDGSYEGFCSGECKKIGFFTMPEYDTDWFCLYCGGLGSSPHCA